MGRLFWKFDYGSIILKIQLWVNYSENSIMGRLFWKFDYGSIILKIRLWVDYSENSIVGCGFLAFGIIYVFEWTALSVWKFGLTMFLLYSVPLPCYDFFKI